MTLPEHLVPMRQSMADNLAAMVRDASASAVAETNNLLEKGMVPASVPRWAYTLSIMKWLLCVNSVMDTMERWTDVTEACPNCTPHRVEMLFRSAVEFRIQAHVAAFLDSEVDTDDMAPTADDVFERLVYILDESVHAHDK